MLNRRQTDSERQISLRDAVAAMVPLSIGEAHRLGPGGRRWLVKHLSRYVTPRLDVIMYANSAGEVLTALARMIACAAFDEPVSFLCDRYSVTYLSGMPVLSIAAEDE